MKDRDAENVCERELMDSKFSKSLGGKFFSQNFFCRRRSGNEKKLSISKSLFSKTDVDPSKQHPGYVLPSKKTTIT